MTLSEFNDQYFFHDSILNKLEYSDGELRLFCEFCDFMQENYDDKDDANSDIIVVFQNAEYKFNKYMEADIPSCAAGNGNKA